MTLQRKILTVVGTRPEAIKMAPLITALAKDNRFQSTVCVSGQHKEMLTQVLDLFGIVPDHDLQVMRPNQSPAQVAARILSEMQPVLDQYEPDIMLVHGDTITASAATFSAYLNGISVGHVEAGLRTGNLNEPWPEEGNRRVIGAVATYHFAPTTTAAENLYKENHSAKSVHITGNTVIDALIQTRDRVKINPDLVQRFDTEFNFLSRKMRTCLVTIHRRESFGDGLKDVCTALLKLVAQNDDLQIVLPVHPNPNISTYIRETLNGVDSIHLINPLEYMSFVALMERADIILTDSGGIQEEAPSLGKPVLVLRNTTERPEAVEAGTVKLVGTDVDQIVTQTQTLLDDKAAYDVMARAHNPYGDGLAVPRILDFLGSI
jgi:UDP-N-acetylglucosamine 2-epimerase (non-hydrolysing)